MTKYITRTVNVKTGVKLEPDYDTKTFHEMQVTLLDCDKVPADVHIDKEEIVKVRMPIEDFFLAGEKITIGQQENL